MNFPFYFILVIVFTSCVSKSRIIIQSPDKSIAVIVELNDVKTPVYTVSKNNKTILEPSALGIVRKDADFSKDLKIIKVSQVKEITDSYTLLTSKRKLNSYFTNKQSIILENSVNQQFEIIFQVSNDGVAFCYRFNKKSDDLKYVLNETSSFNFPKEAKAWLHPQTNAHTGWCNVEPCYEMHYYQNISVGTPAPYEAGWSFPALFLSNGEWILLTESGLEPTYCGSRLGPQSLNGDYVIKFPQDPERTSPSAALKPQSFTPWQTPWRIIMLGGLNQIVESTLVTDLASPTDIKNTDFIKPGRASWSWALLKDNSVVYDVQKKFIDFAAYMNWEYCLIDVEWDVRIGYDKIQELADYAGTKNVGIILWYNSSGSWNTTTYSPKNVMFDPITRRNEFRKISEMGIKGVKVDFWAGDGQSVIEYYDALLRDAAEFRLMVNCHGATIPRGWERTYPNLVTMESVKGFEYVTFDQANADSAATHCAMLPFTRNAIGSMDFTPVCFSEIPGIQRKTSNAFELALSVLFQSGIQHYAEKPEGMQFQPAYVRDFLKQLPGSWDDIDFIEGFPARYVILARKSGEKWYVAGINSSKEARSFDLNLSEISSAGTGTLITDGETNRSFLKKDISLDEGKINLTIKPSGGFVMVLD